MFIPWGVELDDDEVVLADSVREVGAVQSEHELLRFSLVGMDPTEAQSDEQGEAEQNPR